MATTKTKAKETKIKQPEKKKEEEDLDIDFEDVKMTEQKKKEFMTHIKKFLSTFEKMVNKLNHHNVAEYCLTMPYIYLKSSGWYKTEKKEDQKCGIWKFDDRKTIWRELSASEASDIIREYVLTSFSLLGKVMLSNIDKENIKKRKQLVDSLRRVEINIGNDHFLTSCTKVFAGKIYSPDFISKLNKEPFHINFTNGLYDFEKKAFRGRNEKDYVSVTLDFPYDSDVDEEIMDEVKTLLLRTFNDDEEQYEANLAWKGYCLAGYRNQKKILLTTGPLADNGKSTFSDYFSKTFHIYSLETNPDIFVKGCNTRHKELDDMRYFPIRYMYVEEAGTEKMDIRFFKKIADGKGLKLNVLYDNAKFVDNNLAVEIISNPDVNFDSDNGVKTRLWKQELNNRFLKPAPYKRLVDENGGKIPKGVYLADLKLTEKYTHNISYKMALVKLLIPYANKFCQERTLTMPESWDMKAGELCETNDMMADFIDEFYEKTGDKSDKISKSEILMKWEKKYNKKVDWRFLLNDFKRLGFEYARGLHGEFGERGVILGLRRKEQTEELDVDSV